MSEIEKTVRDPNYAHLDKFLGTAKEYLGPNGFFVTSYSKELTNTKLYGELVEKHKWKMEFFAEREGNPSMKQPNLCLLKLTPL